MSVTPLQASYIACRRLVRRSRSSFAISFLMLGPEKRRAMDALYAFMRHTDDLGDSALPPAERRASLSAWRAAIGAALEGRELPDSIGIAAGRLLPALSDTVRRFVIPAACLYDAIDGQEMDLESRFYETFDDLAVYCEKVASAVGVACVYIWGFDTPAALLPARQCGIALQLTNILRDLRDDLAMGRIYLPQADLRACGYSVEEFRQGVVNPAFRRLVELEADRAEGFYRNGRRLFDALTPEGRRALAMMMGTYHALLGEIRCHADRLLMRPARLSVWHKLRIAAGCLLWPGGVQRTTPCDDGLIDRS